jgi:EAL domain-containing protein (putative c-di-GMP-specific phosphodiesterase class I)
VVDLEERRITGIEALVRWHHPELGLLAPAEFMEFEEEVGLISFIGRHVIEQACADIERLQKLLRDRRLSVSVNLTEDELLDAGLVERIEGLLRRHGLESSSLRVELLERVAQAAPVADTLRRLREIGVGVYIDDFGTGYSSLSRLHELPVSVLKVDRDFVRAMSLGESGEKIVNSIIGLAQNLGLGVIAEGAASADDVRRLHHFGCHQVQGFYFSKAVPFEAAADMLRNPQALTDKFIALSA